MGGKVRGGAVRARIFHTGFIAALNERNLKTIERANALGRLKTTMADEKGRRPEGN